MGNKLWEVGRGWSVSVGDRVSMKREVMPEHPEANSLRVQGGIERNESEKYRGRGESGRLSRIVLAKLSL